ncbi:MAG TPA: choice-of-anchor D domain-containing protein [Verrucomicrobiales bacterium]|nr:choice-of-anchor D domain-containing protein [Verrucomicrobiales bacterium]
MTAFVTILFALWFSLPGIAATYRVEATGNDTTGNGTASAPWRTIQKAVNVAAAGDTVLVGPGTYTENVSWASAPSGKSGSRITFDGQNGATVNQMMISRPYVTIKNFRFKGNTPGGELNMQIRVMHGAHFLEVLNCEFDKDFQYEGAASKHTGITWQAPAAGTMPFGDGRVASDCLIEGNNLHRFRAATYLSMYGDRNIVRNNQFHDGAQADWLWLWGRQNLIQGNRFYNMYDSPGDGNHSDWIQTFGSQGAGSQDHIIEQNAVYDMIGAPALGQLEGSLVPEIKNWVWRNNVFYNIGNPLSCSIPGMVFYNNVFYKCGYNGGVMGFGTRTYSATAPGGYNGQTGSNYCHNTVFRNNVFLDCGKLTSGSGGWYNNSLDSIGCSADYNFVARINFAAVRPDPDQRLYGDPGGWDSQEFYEPHGINGGNPGFVNADAGDFRLLPGSPLIDRGLTIPSILRDHGGSPRPQGAGYDIGAFEFQSGGAPTTPVMSASPTSLSFGSIPVGNNVNQTLTVRNAGSGTLTGNATVAAPFSIVSGGAYSLAAGLSQTVTIKYTPTAAGTDTQNITLSGGGGASVTASGTATVTPALGVSPASLNFGTLQPGQTADGTLTVQNTGGGTLTGAASVGAPFSIVSGGTYSLTAGQTQAVKVRYSPAAEGTHSANVSLTGGAGFTAPVSGTATGIPAIAVTPASIDFGSIAMGSSSTQTLTVRNSGTGILQGTASVGSPFSVVSGGSYSLAAGASQTVSVKYAPVSTGSHAQAVTFTGGAGFRAGVSGTAQGVASITVTPATLNFGSVALGASATQTLTVRNAGTAPLTGAASVTAPFSITAGSYNLAPGASQTVSVTYTPTTVDSHSRTVTLSGGGGSTAAVSGTATAPPPVVSAITPGGTDANPAVAGWQTYATATAQYSGSASDPNSLPLSWQWIYTINGGAETVLLSGTGQVTDASYSYPANSAGSNYVWKLRVSNGYTTGESVLSVGVEAPPSGGPDVSFPASTGAITAPFSTTSNYISQAIQTTEPTEGGRAVYSFNVPRTGKYWIQAQVRTAGDGANSFFLNVDAEPEAPGMIWDIPLTNEFEKRIVSWRGNGTDGANQFTPKFFNLSAGQHQLIIRGRERNTQLSSVSIIKLPDPPQRLRVK